MKEQKKYTFDVLNIERLTDADPKRYQKFNDIIDQLLPFYDQIWLEISKFLPPLPESCTFERMEKFLSSYKDQLDLELPKEAWFDQLKQIGKENGFAASNAEFKEGGYI